MPRAKKGTEKTVEDSSSNKTSASTKTRASTAASERPKRKTAPVRAFTFSLPTPSEQANASKKTKSTKKPTKKSTKGNTVSTRKTVPPYSKLILRVITAIGHRVGSSVIGIANYIEKNYPVKEGFKRYVKAALKRGVESGDIVHNGALYRVSAKGKNGSSRSKRVAKKSAEGSSSGKVRVKKPTSARKTATSNTKEASTTAASKTKEASTTLKRKKSDAKASTESSASKAPKKPVGLNSDYIWQYEDNGSVWRNYDTEASNTVEDVYQKYLANRGETDVRAIQSGQWEYLVDFLAMKQTNIQHANHTVRNIRRLRCAS